MTARAHILALLVAGLCACKGACKGSAREQGDSRARAAPVEAVPQPEHTVIRHVELHTAAPGHGLTGALDPQALGRQLGRQLAQSPFFAAEADDVPPGRRPRAATVEARIHHDVLDSAERGGRVLVVAIESRVLWVEPAGDLAPAVHVFVERMLEPEERGREDRVLVAFVADALLRIGHDLIAKEQARTGGPDALAQALASSDPEQVLFALDLIAARRDLGMLDAVLGTLGSDHAAIRNRSLGTLVALGDPRAVDALAKRAAFDDHELMRMVIEAAAALGGHDASEYLEFVASGHTDETLREHARDGLERVRRRDPP